MGSVVNVTAKRPGTLCVGGCVGLDGCRKSRLPPKFDTHTARPVPSRYTDSCRGPRTPWSGLLLENLVVVYLPRTFIMSYGSRVYCHIGKSPPSTPDLSQINPIQSTPTFVVSQHSEIYDHVSQVVTSIPVLRSKLFVHF